MVGRMGDAGRQAGSMGRKESEDRSEDPLGELEQHSLARQALVD